jgi:release factor glutamine methyltransferase
LINYSKKFDVIISNPPYIAANDAHLQTADLRYEPASALTDFADGLKHYRNIVVQAAPRLKSGGKLILEHGWQQSPAIIATSHNITMQQNMAKQVMHEC